MTDFPDIVEYRYNDPATDTNYSAYFRDLGSIIAFAIGQLGPNVTPAQVLANLYDPEGKPLADRPDVTEENVTAVATATGQTVQLPPEAPTAPEGSPVAASDPTVPDGAGTGQTPVDVPAPAAAEAPGVLTPAPAVPVTDSVTPIPADVSTDSGTATPTPDTSIPVASDPFAVSPPLESAPLSTPDATPASSNVDSESTDFDATPDSADVNTADGPVTADTAPSIGAPITADNNPGAVTA